MFQQKIIQPEQLKLACNQGARPLHKAIESLEKVTFYPWDNHLVELLRISRAVDQSDFSLGSIDAKFIEQAAIACKSSVAELLAAAQNSKHPLFAPASYTFAAYSAGKEGIEDALRFFRWRYFEMDSDTAGLDGFHPRIDGFRALSVGEYFIGQLWGTHLDNPHKSQLGLLFGPSAEPQSDDFALNRTDTMAEVGKRICDWLGLTGSRISVIGGHVDLTQFSEVRSGSSAFAEIIFPKEWQWPHRSDEWKIELVKV